MSKHDTCLLNKRGGRLKPDSNLPRNRTCPTAPKLLNSSIIRKVERKKPMLPHWQFQPAHAAGHRPTRAPFSESHQSPVLHPFSGRGSAFGEGGRLPIRPISKKMEKPFHGKSSVQA